MTRLLYKIFMPKVTIFTTPTCVYCKMTKEYFKAKNVAYEEKNVAADAAARDEMITSSGQMGVPVIKIMDDKGESSFVIGFDQEQLAQLLGIKD